MQDTGSQINVICLEPKAFYTLIEKVVNRLSDNSGSKEDKWIDDQEAMRLLRSLPKPHYNVIETKEKFDFLK